MSIQNQIIIFISKFANIVSRRLRIGSGTAITGLLAELLSSSILDELISQIPNIILITGTNGKTTTQSIITNILEVSGNSFISNKSGANLKRGILSTLIKNTNIFGRLDFKYGIFEVEEATMPRIIKVLNPRIVIITNLFRDQLDAYGEIDRTQKLLKKAIQQVRGSTLILNGDDPKVSTLNNTLDNKTIYFALDSKYKSYFEYEGEKATPVRLRDTHIIENIHISSDLTTNMTFDGNKYKLHLIGKFNTYNTAAAILATQEIGIDKNHIEIGIDSSKPAFGRGESISKDKYNYQFMLVKNPTGMSLTLDLLKHVHKPQIIFILNDNIADGRDISWIWDAQLEMLEQIRPSSIICSGTRAEDMLLRVKYAMDSLQPIGNNKYFCKKSNTTIIFTKTISQIHRTLTHTNFENKNFFVLPTYTAMLTFRKYLLGRALNE